MKPTKANFERVLAKYGGTYSLHDDGYRMYASAPAGKIWLAVGCGCFIASEETKSEVWEKALFYMSEGLANDPYATCDEHGRPLEKCVGGL